MRLLIDVASQDHRPGEVVRGSISVEDAREVRGLRARLVLRERSESHTATAWETEWETLAGPGEPPAEVEFALRLPPEAIPNPEGAGGPVRWEVEALADRSRRFDVQARAPVSVVSDGSVRSPRADERIEGRRAPRQKRRRAVRPGKLWAIAALVLAILGIPLVVLGFLLVGETLASQDPQEGWALVLVGGICIGIAPPIWLVAVRRVQVPRSRRLEVAVDPERARRGGAVRADLSASEASALRSQPTVVLELLELSDVDQQIAGQETRVTVEASRWRSELHLDATAAVAELEIPADEPFSYAGSCRSYVWRIVAREGRTTPGRKHAPEIERAIWVDP